MLSVDTAVQCEKNVKTIDRIHAYCHFTHPNSYYSFPIADRLLIVLGY